MYLSFDIDAVDPGFAPGTGWPEPGGLYPREVLKLVRRFAAEGLLGMEVVEVSPPYDVSDVTSLLGVRLVCEALAAGVGAGRLGRARDGRPHAPGARGRPSAGLIRWPPSRPDGPRPRPARPVRARGRAA
ncbi:hypothetical protein BJF79_22655 [Actinomadura sp. CNU-125]|uniref:arginase family protein n=1 Tax=Actinomadura sp. CNU-125 TaxID=1904961 RepID=UPI00096005B7|nr:arginase family protein [Actinomadura sp. CNU-125]OLT12313.1 hypothetical protein BJF79_22655 [Actinomadura sp. CNU-125]